MKISLLREREDFQAIFSESVKNYFLNRYQKKLKIDWQNGTAESAFVCNDLLNIIYPIGINRARLAPLTQEFSWDKSFLKRVLQKLFVYFSVRYPFEKMFSSKLYISSEDLELNELVFIPGNHSIRVIDTIKNVSTVMYKDGFCRELTKTDSKTRIDFPFISTPKILNYDYEQGWFEEERVIGLPLNRIGDSDKVKSLQDHVKSQLLKLYNTTKRRVKVSEYGRELSQKLKAAIEKGKFSSQNCQQLNAIEKKILGKIDLEQHTELVVARTHGDLQPANVLCNSSQFWIIDWEYSGERSIYYDALVFEIEIRRTDTIAHNLSKFKQGINNGDVYCDWVNDGVSKINSYYFYIFLLEDLIVKAEELLFPRLEIENESFNRYLQQINTFLNE